MKKISLLIIATALIGCSNETTKPDLVGYCYDEIVKKGYDNIDCWAWQELKVKDSTAQNNYLITTWHKNSGYPIRSEWNCGITYARKQITYINVERISYIECRK